MAANADPATLQGAVDRDSATTHVARRHTRAAGDVRRLRETAYCSREAAYRSREAAYRSRDI